MARCVLDRHELCLVRAPARNHQRLCLRVDPHDDAGLPSFHDEERGVEPNRSRERRDDALLELRRGAALLRDPHDVDGHLGRDSAEHREFPSPCSQFPQFRRVLWEIAEQSARNHRVLLCCLVSLQTI